MESLVIHNGHRIVIDHHLDSMKLVVDNVIYATISGLKNTNKDNTLVAEIPGENGLLDEIIVKYVDAKLTRLTGSLLFYYNGKLIAEKKTL